MHRGGFRCGARPGPLRCHYGLPVTVPLLVPLTVIEDSGQDSGEDSGKIRSGYRTRRRGDDDDDDDGASVRTGQG